jgi:regulator of sigma E protease
VVIERDGHRLTERITPRYDAANRIMRLGFSYGETLDVGPPRAAVYTVEGMWRVTRATVTAIVRVFYDSSARKQVSGVVGSYETTRQSFEFDVAQAINVLAIISLSLAIVNLFPFLPLDGGHIFWAVAEKVRGRAIPFEVMERSMAVGFVLVLTLFVIGLTNDIGRLQGQGLRPR